MSTVGSLFAMGTVGIWGATVGYLAYKKEKTHVERLELIIGGALVANLFLMLGLDMLNNKPTDKPAAVTSGSVLRSDIPARNRL